jgi:hypothetical protein
LELHFDSISINTFRYSSFFAKKEPEREKEAVSEEEEEEKW